MSTKDIQETIYQMFYCDLVKNTISRIRNKIIPEMLDWHVECNTQKKSAHIICESSKIFENFLIF